MEALRVQPDVIFMDIEMPGKNGLEAAAVIKKQIQTVHIIFLTAYDRFDYAVGAIRSGGEDRTDGLAYVGHIAGGRDNHGAGRQNAGAVAVCLGHRK